MEQAVCEYARVLRDRFGGKVPDTDSDSMDWQQSGSCPKALFAGSAGTL
ncbi:MAG: hypothetical protein ACRC10_09530 [Thermoguttaceae bacterium]